MLPCEAYHYRQSSWRVMCTLTQIHLSGVANFFSAEMLRAPSKALEAAGNLSWRSGAIYAEHNSAVSLGAEPFNAEQLEQLHSKQLRAGLDISCCTRLGWVRTERWWFTCAPPTCLLPSTTKREGAFCLRVWLGATVTGESAPCHPSFRFPPGMCESLHRRARRQKQSTKRVRINNVATWAVQGRQIV